MSRGSRKRQLKGKSVLVSTGREVVQSSGSLTPPPPPGEVSAQVCAVVLTLLAQPSETSCLPALDDPHRKSDYERMHLSLTNQNHATDLLIDPFSTVHLASVLSSGMNGAHKGKVDKLTGLGTDCKSVNLRNALQQLRYAIWQANSME